MKDKLLDLIDGIETVKTCFTRSSDKDGPFAATRTIYSTPEFVEWSQSLQFELQEIYDRTHNQFIFDTLIILKQKFNGWNDERFFKELSGKLFAIKDNINKFFPTEIEDNPYTEGAYTMITKPAKIFISHSSDDRKYVQPLVNLLCDIGLNANHIFCSSVPGYGIPLDRDIYDFLKQQFQEYISMCFLSFRATIILLRQLNTRLTPAYTPQAEDGRNTPSRGLDRQPGLP